MNLSPDLVDDPIFQVISRLADCLCTELAAAGGPGLCYCGLWVGTQGPPLGPSTGGCDTGVAWVRLVDSYPSAFFPAPDDGTQSLKCSSPMAYQVEIGVARPVPRPEGRNLFPDPQDMFNAQRLIASDMRASLRALRCCLPQRQKAAGSEIMVAAGNWTPLDNAAGKGGGMWAGFIGWA